MSNLRHDLLTSGWSMMDCGKWVQPLNEQWPTLFYAALSGFFLKEEERSFNCQGIYPPILQNYVDEITGLLREALPDELIRMSGVELRQTTLPFWHTDGGYLRALFTIRGEGTWAAHRKDDNVQTPPGYVLIITGQVRKYHKGIQQTWHSGPKSDDGDFRRLLLVNYY